MGIAGKYAERPVIELIGGWPREQLAIHQTGGNIPEALARGVRNFKIGPHTPPDEMGTFVVRSRLYQAELDPSASEEAARLRVWLEREQ